MKAFVPKGIIDTHVHSAPDVNPRLLSDVELSRDADEAGYRALVLKGHHSITATRATLAEEVCQGDVRVFGGLVLNDSASGGMNPSAVEAAGKLGAKMIWMPTFSSANHMVYLEGEGPNAALAGIGSARKVTDVVDAEGNLLPETLEVLALIAKYDMTLATGHLSSAEIMTLVPAAKRAGVDRVVITHPEMECVAMPVGDQLQLAELGGVWFERVAVVTYEPLSFPMKGIVNAIQTVGAATTILATDLGQPKNPSPIVGMESYIGSLLDCGLSKDDIEQMTCASPAAALALDTI